MSLYSDYLKEVCTANILEDSDGFITYAFFPPACYIRDWYVKPESRGAGSMRYIDHAISEAKAAGCTQLQTTINMKTPEPLRSKNLSMYLKYGFKLLSSQPEMIWLTKEI